MIFRKRPEKAPAVLTTDGIAAADTLKQQWNAGQKKFESTEFDGTIYSHDQVKKALSDGDIHKCYYCEIPYAAVAHGTVDHYRPKTIVNNTGKKLDRQPGYYWLAYEWTNLLLACPRCNTRIKRNQFPLAPNSPRALSHHDNIEDEQPLLIDPAVTDPALHIEWRDHIPYPKAASPRGEATIKVLRLDCRKVNRALLEYREQYLLWLWNSYQLLRHEPGNADAARAIKEAQKDGAAFSAMVREAIRCWDAGGKPSFTN